MAGYLIHHEDSYTASVLYCELHPQDGSQAKLILYENELCRSLVMEIFLTDRSVCCEKVGINCSCFVVESHQFSSRTLSERKLWLRAISNVKVKLQNHAPQPLYEELSHYRSAIKDHIQSIKVTLEGTAQMDALLQRINRKSNVSHSDSLYPLFPVTLAETIGAADPTNACRVAEHQQRQSSHDNPSAPACTVLAQTIGATAPTNECRVVEHQHRQHSHENPSGPACTILEHRTKSVDGVQMSTNRFGLATDDPMASFSTSKDYKEDLSTVASDGGTASVMDEGTPASAG